jgi:periplasmic copper chaperone A
MRTLFLAAALLAAGPACAQPAPPAVQASDVWARATAPGQTVGAAYATLTSPAPDRLVGAETPVAGRAELHTMTMEGTVMRMRPVGDGVALPAGQPIALAPGGLHLMLMDLRTPLRAGQNFPLTLRFEHAPPLTVTVPVEPIGAQRR